MLQVNVPYGGLAPRRTDGLVIYYGHPPMAYRFSCLGHFRLIQRIAGRVLQNFEERFNPPSA
jgi:hypothetical protein